MIAAGRGADGDHGRERDRRRLLWLEHSGRAAQRAADAPPCSASPRLAQVKDLEPTRDRLLLDTDGGPLAAQVVIAADGQGSRLRSLAGIAVTEWSYAGGAGRLLRPFAAAWRHIHRISRAPAPSPPCRCPAIAQASSGWTGQRIQAALAMTDALFCSTLQAEMHGDLGRIGAPGPRRAFPMRSWLAASWRAAAAGRRAAHLHRPSAPRG